jgi:hypothetical protein
MRLAPFLMRPPFLSAFANASGTALCLIDDNNAASVPRGKYVLFCEISTPYMKDHYLTGAASLSSFYYNGIVCHPDIFTLLRVTRVTAAKPLDALSMPVILHSREQI